MGWGAVQMFDLSMIFEVFCFGAVASAALSVVFILGYE